MVKDFKYIIRRILIGVGITLLLGYIGTLTGFIIPLDVYAMEKPDFLIGINNNTNSSEPVYKNGLNSNVFKEDFSNSPNLQFGYGQVNVSINSLDSNNGINVPYWDNFDTLKNDLTSQFSFPNYSGYNSYVYYYNFKPNGNLVLKYDNHYTLLLLITRGDNSNYQTGFPDISLDSLKFSVGNDNTLIEGKSFLSNVKSSYYKIQEKVDSYTEYSYILLDFDVNSDVFPSYNGNIYLQSINLSSEIFYDSSSVKLPLSYFLESHRVGNNSDAYFDVDFYFLENAYIGYFGISCDINGCHSSAGFNDMYDYVTSQDLDILNVIDTCPSEFSLESVVCNIKRVFDMIFRFFVRISNFFKELFNDSISWDLDNNSDMTPVSSLLTMPITLLNAFLTGFDATCSTYNFGSLYEHNILLPCISLSDYLGSTLWAIIDGLCGIFMCFNIGRLIVTFFDKSTSLDDMFGLMYHYHDYEIKSDPDYNVDNINN